MSVNNNITGIYNPKMKSDNQIKDEFVVRLREFEIIFQDIKTSKGKHPEQCYLIIGQRGAGKTTLLERLRIAIKEEKSLSWLIPVPFNEEQYNINELANLWERIAEYLEDYQGMTGLVEALHSHQEKEKYEEPFFRELTKRLDKEGKKLILFIDNIGDMLMKFDELEVKRLREVLMTDAHIRLMAGSPVVLDDLFDYQKPFMEFFKVIYLRGLNEEEMKKLLLRLGELNNKEEQIKRIITETPERVEMLRRLTGGVTRTVIMLFNIFANNEDGRALKDFMELIDNATPLYKHNMDDLKPQQQAIMDALAKAWDGVTVKYLKGKVRLESKLISAQLKQLEKNQIVISRKGKGKNLVYMLQDRFFNMWYLMRHGRRNDAQRVIYLVKFFESWLGKDGIEQNIGDHIANLERGTYDQGAAALYARIILNCASVDFNSKLKLFEKTRENVSPNIVNEIQMPYGEVDDKIYELFQKEKYEEALELSGKNLSIGWIGYVYLHSSAFLLRQFDLSITFLERAIELDLNDPLKYIVISRSYLNYQNKPDKAIQSLRFGMYKLLESIRNNNEKEIKYFLLNLQEENVGIVLGSLFLELANLYINNLGDYLRGKKYLLRAAIHGSGNAYARLGLLEIGNNRTIGTEYLEKAFIHNTDMLNALCIYFSKVYNVDKDYVKAKEVIIRIRGIRPSNDIGQIMQLHCDAIFNLWGNDIDDSISAFKDFMRLFSAQEHEKGIQDIIKAKALILSYFQLLLAKHQYHSALKLFNEFNLKDELKPIYYTLMYFMNNEDEMLKMGDELKETVEEVIKKVEQMRIDYKRD